MFVFYNLFLYTPYKLKHNYFIEKIIWRKKTIKGYICVFRWSDYSFIFVRFVKIRRNSS